MFFQQENEDLDFLHHIKGVLERNSLPDEKRVDFLIPNRLIENCLELVGQFEDIYDFEIMDTEDDNFKSLVVASKIVTNTRF